MIQMTRVSDLIAAMSENPQEVRFKDLCKVCDEYFGSPRQSRGSHRIYKTPWPGDPRVNIQNDHGRAKSYQVRQVLRAIRKLEERE